MAFFFHGLQHVPMGILRTTIAYGSCLTHCLYANFSVTISLMACALHTISMHASSTTITDGPCLTVGRKSRIKSIECRFFYGEAMAIFFPRPYFRLWLVPHTPSVCQHECNYVTDGLCLAHHLYAHLKYNYR